MLHPVDRSVQSKREQFRDVALVVVQATTFDRIASRGDTLCVSEKKPPGTPDPPSAPITVNPAWDRPLTTSQLARFLQVSASTLARQIVKDKIPSIKVAGKIRFLPSEVLRHLRDKQK